MEQKYWTFIKRMVITFIMALITSIIGIVFNLLAGSITESLPDFISSSNKKVKRMNNYEKQVLQSVVDVQHISDRIDNIGGLGDIKEDIRVNVLLPLQHSNIFFSSNAHALRPSRGILLYGPPGTGKTMLARAIAAEANVPFISLTLSSLENKYFGESNRLIQAAFSLARKLQPCIIFFDEIDGFMRHRTETDQSGSYGMKTEFLSQLDGMGTKDDDSIFVIGTTNNISSLDAALRRRLPKVYKVDLPNEEERFEILKLKVKGENISDAMLKWVAQNTTKASGSDLCEIIRRAASYRLHDQYNNPEFRQQLEIASCVEDIHPLISLSKAHFTKALHAMNFTLDDSDEEEAPPPPEK